MKFHIDTNKILSIQSEKTKQKDIDNISDDITLESLIHEPDENKPKVSGSGNYG